MNPTLKKIESILTNTYDHKDFVEFVNEIFHGMDFVAPDIRNKEFSNFSSHILASTHIGNFGTSDNKKIIIISVELKSDKYVENARSTQRNFVKKLIENNNADGAFVAFYTNNNRKWRLSLVRLEYKIQFQEGKLKAGESLTPAKRYSYLVGEGEPCRTAMESFRKLLATKSDEKALISLDNLEEAFSVEKVTNEFYGLYKEKFHQLRDQLEANENFMIEAKQHGFTSEQFAKKLMGQIVFLYFLQKKGWLGVNAWPDKLNEKEYKDAYYAKGTKSRELIPKLYVEIEKGRYKLSGKALKQLSDADEAILAECVKGEPWGKGPQDFMRKLFQLAEKRESNFFNDLLEPLFYDALNVNRGEQGYWPALHCRIPFLSGGLFEPIDGYYWQHNDFEISNETFSNMSGKGPYEADGILDIFDRYNFTINENEPMEHDVAIDPEMLGKVFENLLEIKDRKSIGAFYTPREIVHYMCQESLVNYLSGELEGIREESIRDFILYGDLMRDEDTIKGRWQVNQNMLISEELYEISQDGVVITNRLKDMDEALRDVRIADPAVGSGAFPLGMLNEIVRARHNISAYYKITMNDYQIRFMYQTERSFRNLKYETIKNSIFAVDIDPSAVDIAQLRLWLSLVIDDEVNPEAQSIIEGDRNPQPLPNLESNILCGNSLIDEFEGIKLINENELFGLLDEEQQNMFQADFNAILPHLIAAKDELFKCRDTKKKKELQEKIEALRDMIIKSQLELNQNTNPEILAKYEETKKMSSKPFILWQLDFARVFRDKGGFDIVIGNPPYVKEYTNSSIFRILKSNPYYQGKMDLWYLFACVGIDLLRDKGTQCFIAPNNWVTNAGALILRNKILKETEIRHFIDFGDYKVFTSASIQTMVYLLEKMTNARKSYPLKYSRLEGEDITNDILSDFLYRTRELNNKYDTVQIDSMDGYIRFHTREINNIVKGMKTKNTLYLRRDEIAQGIVAPQENLNKTNQIKLGDGHKVGEGIFVLTCEECIDGRFSNQDIEALIRPFYTSNELGRYKRWSKNNYCIIYTKSDANKIIKSYPTIKRHLDQYKSIVTSSNKPYGLHRARNEDFFLGEKIISIRKCIEPTFTHVDFDSYVSQTFNIIKTDRINMLYLTGLLNSTLIKFWLRHMGKMQGNHYQIDVEPLAGIPITIPENDKEKEMIDYVTQIKKMDFNENQEEINLLESRIDKIIYEIYGLSGKEIDFVEKWRLEP